MDIPACGTVLITEKNEETSKFFKDNDVVFHKQLADIPEAISIFFKDTSIAKLKSENGYKAITNGAFSHKKIMFNLLDEIFDKR
jgi:spore maturation protein CgeB